MLQTRDVLCQGGNLVGIIKHECPNETLSYLDMYNFSLLLGFIGNS